MRYITTLILSVATVLAGVTAKEWGFGPTGTDSWHPNGFGMRWSVSPKWVLEPQFNLSYTQNFKSWDLTFGVNYLISGKEKSNIYFSSGISYSSSTLVDSLTTEKTYLGIPIGLQFEYMIKQVSFVFSSVAGVQYSWQNPAVITLGNTSLKWAIIFWHI